MDLLDWLVILFVSKKTGLKENIVSDIYLAGKPWFTTDYTDKIKKDAKEDGLDVKSVLETTRNMDNQVMGRVKKDIVEGRAHEPVPENWKRIKDRVGDVVKKTGQSREDVIKVLDGVREYGNRVTQTLLKKGS